MTFSASVNLLMETQQQGHLASFRSGNSDFIQIIRGTQKWVGESVT